MGEQTDAEPSIVRLREDGLSWEEICEMFELDIREATQRYRDEAYDYWDTGWEFTAADGMTHVETGAVEFWTEDAETTVRIPELRDTIPLVTIADTADARTYISTSLTAAQARELANTLAECADIMEGDDG